MKRFLLGLFTLFLACWIPGCKGSDDPAGPDPCTLQDFVGNWEGVMSGSVAGISYDGRTLVLTIAQEGTGLAGTARASAPDGSPNTGNFRASVDGCTAAFVVELPGELARIKVCRNQWDVNGTMMLTGSYASADIAYSGTFCGEAGSIAAAMRKRP